VNNAPLLLIAPDKFKGCLTATEVADAVCVGVHRAGGTTQVRPLADGGDGSVEAAIHAGFEEHQVSVPDALGRQHEAKVALRGRHAVVEVANTCGLALAGAPTRDLALHASSAGLGVAVKEVVSRGATTVVLGLGGSASTDGGIGFLAALGARVLDVDGEPVAPGGAGLAAVARVDLAPLAYLHGITLVAATDVTAPLAGTVGAAHVFGTQKGASAADIELLDRGLAQIARRLSEAVGSQAPSADRPGAGSAGGVGFAAAAIGARLVSGADYFLDLLEFDQVVPGCDAVVTGEGAIDDQTLMGKLPAVVAARSRGLPVHVVAGRNDLSVGNRERIQFASVRAVSELDGADMSADPELTRKLLARIAEQITREVGAATRPLRRPEMSA